MEATEAEGQKIGPLGTHITEKNVKKKKRGGNCRWDLGRLAVVR
jgi:hypothetical protein